MKVFKYTKKSHTFNEDKFFVSKNLFGVIDGATNLSFKGYKYKSEASILADFLKKEILKVKKSFTENTLVDLSKKAVSLNLTSFPSCGISIVKIENNKLKLFSLGDLDIIYKLKTGEVFNFKKYDLINLDKIALEELKNVAIKRGFSIKNSLPFITDTLKKHRALKNKKGGYDVFEPLEKPSFAVYTVELPLESVESFIICSDGFSSSLTTFNILSSYEEFFKTNPMNVVNEIKKRAEEDKDFNLYPRFKKIDDITIVKVDL
ncbi:MAG: hypothetical protein E7342_01745 [Clostridiales bacterium]|nr:hypothetical protein [Clostridiales bacterium]